MKLYLIRPIYEWDPWFDKCFGMVIRAENEENARKVAFNSAEDNYNSCEGKEVWLDKSKTYCDELKCDDEEEEIILRDVRWA